MWVQITSDIKERHRARKRFRTAYQKRQKNTEIEG